MPIREALGGSVPGPSAPADKNTAEKTFASGTGVRPSEGPGRVLLVDDSPIALDAVAEMLEDAGFHVEIATSGTEAVRRAQGVPPEVIVCDLNMPDMDGLEVFRRVQAFDDTVPVVVLSEDDDLERVLATIHAGVFDFVQKTKANQMLSASVARAVRHTRILRENRALSDGLRRANEDLERRVAEQTEKLRDQLRREAALERAAALAPLKKELEIAREIQTSLVPKTFAIPEYDVAARMITASEVGGDYYDVVPAPNGFWVGIGDVAGHGLGAGLLMLMVQSGVATLALQLPDEAPGSLIGPLNEMLFENVRNRLCRNDHVTFTLLRFFQDGRVVFAGAHEDVLVARREGGPIQSVVTEGPWLAATRDVRGRAPQKEMKLDPGDLLVLYTDGIIEARRGREIFGLPRLLAALDEVRSRPVAEVAAALVEAGRAWSGRVEDDMTLVAIRYRGGSAADGGQPSPEAA